MRSLDRRPGMQVRVIDLGSTEGLLIDPEYLDQRRVGAQGRLVRPLKNDDFWWVRHFDGTEAPYSYREIEPEPESDGWGESPLG